MYICLLCMMFNMKNGKENDILKSYNVFHQDSSHILYINSLRLYVTGPGVQADRARRGEWGRERSITDKPGPALPDFDRPGLAWGVGEGEVCYTQTWLGTPGFRLDKNEVPSPRTDIDRVVMHWKLSALQCRISNLFLWSSNSILCLCFCCNEEERKCFD
jgi:hypothetical protein